MTNLQMHGQLSPVSHDVLRAISYLRDGLIPAYELNTNQLIIVGFIEEKKLKRRMYDRTLPSILEIEL